MQFPAQFIPGMGHVLLESTKGFRTTAERKFVDLMVLSSRLKGHPQYNRDDFADLHWFLGQIKELYLEMVQQLQKLMPYLDADQPECTREAIEAILAHEAAFAKMAMRKIPLGRRR